MSIKGVLHIGGHFGQEISTYHKHHIPHIMVFEPVPSTFAILQQNAGGQAILINTALGSTVGTVEMYIETANQGQSNSILKPALHLLQYPHIPFEYKITVPITTLDTFIESMAPYNFINMDVQGYELEVLKGAKQTLAYIDYIYTEVNRDMVYQDCAMVEDLDLFLDDFGFFRVETSWNGGTWGDALYIKGPRAS